jgi:hypothetical protein
MKEKGALKALQPAFSQNSIANNVFIFPLPRIIQCNSENISSFSKFLRFLHEKKLSFHQFSRKIPFNVISIQYNSICGGKGWRGDKLLRHKCARKEMISVTANSRLLVDHSHLGQFVTSNDFQLLHFHCLTID